MLGACWALLFSSIGSAFELECSLVQKRGKADSGMFLFRLLFFSFSQHFVHFECTYRGLVGGHACHVFVQDLHSFWIGFFSWFFFSFFFSLRLFLAGTRILEAFGILQG